jgi:hypothetical protein
MAKVFIFGMGGVIVIGLIMLAVFGASLSAKLASLFWREKKKDKEESSGKDNDQGPHGPAGGGSGTRWV